MGGMFQAARKKLTGDHDNSKGKTEGPQKAKFELQVESPPLIFHGPPSSSTGALFSGQLKITVFEPRIRLTSFVGQFLVHTHTKKPVAHHCKACSTQTNQVHKWHFLTEPKLLEQGTHSFPFSYLLGGHLPATTSHTLGAINYSIAALAKTDTGYEIPFTTPVNIARAIISDRDRHSVRVFPPTSVSAHLSFPNAVHPDDGFDAQLSIDSLVNRVKGCRWNLKRITWRIDEHVRIISPACKQHCARIGGEGKGVMHEDIEVIGGKEIKSGWKTDFDFGTNGRTELEFRASAVEGVKASCDMESASGMKVWHKLVIEMIVAEEQLPTKTSKHVVPTGSARVLRMEFDLQVTDRSGMGVSWDEEMPPLYDDVPPRPPQYPVSTVPAAVAPSSRASSDHSILEVPDRPELLGPLESFLSRSSLVDLPSRATEYRIDLRSFSRVDLEDQPPDFSEAVGRPDVYATGHATNETEEDVDEGEGLVMAGPSHR